MKTDPYVATYWHSIKMDNTLPLANPPFDYAIYLFQSQLAVTQSRMVFFLYTEFCCSRMQIARPTTSVPHAHHSLVFENLFKVYFFEDLYIFHLFNK